MSKHYLIPVAILWAVLSATTISAQRPGATPARPTATPATQPAPTPQAPANVVLPISKMAVVDTQEFLDPKTGIAKFNNLVTKLNGEFQRLRDEINQGQQRLQTLQDEITKLQNAPAGTPIDQQSLQAKISQAEQLNKDLTRKREDAQASYEKRRQELFSPLQIEIGTALEAFAKARGINVIIDAAQVPLLYAADSIDITRAFINEFNSKNPATASTPTPR